MATYEEAKGFADAVDSKLSQVLVRIQELKDQVAGGGVVSQQQLDDLVVVLSSANGKADQALL